MPQKGDMYHRDQNITNHIQRMDKPMIRQAKGIDFETAYLTLIKGYIRIHSLPANKPIGKEKQNERK
jgi:hypothetical protein